MNCPSCSNALSVFYYGGVGIMACQDGCAGLWFDRYEIKKINQNNFGSGGDLLKISQTEGIRLFRNVDHICPKCEMTLLLRHFFDRKRGLEVDQCARCGGIWVEMGTVLKGNESEVEREKLIDDYFTFIYEKKVLKMDLMISDIRLAAEQILQVFRFLGMPEKLDFGVV
jgi:uncharacterized protein